MSRTSIAILAGLIFLVAYLVGALALADFVVTWHWLLQSVFFVVAGTLWVWPIYRLMVWAIRPR